MNIYPVTSSFLEVVSKCQMAFESKAQADEKAQSAANIGGLFRRRRTRWGSENIS
jgi:hypothetical protein